MRLIILTIVVIIFAWPSTGYAQPRSNDFLVRGTVTDASGKGNVPVANVLITATGEQGNVIKTVSDKDGKYQLALGTIKYSVEFVHKDFVKAMVRDVTAKFLEETILNVRLEKGSKSECPAPDGSGSASSFPRLASKIYL